MSDRFTYPARALLADYARAAAGLPLVLLVLWLPMHPALALFFGSLALLFLGFGLRTLRRQISPILLADEGIATGGPLPRTIPWAALGSLRLRYYSMRRDRARGWLELILEGNGARIGIESSITGFETILARAAAAAARRGLHLDEATQVNLAALVTESGGLGPPVSP